MPPVSFTSTRLRRTGLAAVAAALVWAAPAAADCPDADITPSASNLVQTAVATVCLINEQRAGLQSVRPNALLAQAAAGHNQAMLEQNFFEHTQPNGTTMLDRIRATGYLSTDAAWSVGENLAWGTGTLATPRKIVEAWMNSAGHRANILNGTYDEIGIAVNVGAPGHPGEGATYTTDYGFVDDPVATTAAASPQSGSESGTAATAPTKAKKAKTRRVCRIHRARSGRKHKSCRRVAAKSSRKR